MAGKYIDFDEARAERQREPVVLHAYGQDFDLPGSIPADLLLQVVRMQQDKGDDAEMTGGDALRLLEKIVPVDVMNELLTHADFSADDLIALMYMIIGAYTGSPDGNGSGKAKAPVKAARKSSSRAGA